MNIVKLRGSTNGKNTGKQYIVGIPAPIGRLLDEAQVETFEVKMTDEGILLRPVTEETQDETLPEWLKARK